MKKGAPDPSSSSSSSSSSDEETDSYEQRVRKYSKIDRRNARDSLKDGQWKIMTWQQRLIKLQSLDKELGKTHKHKHFVVEKDAGAFDAVELDASLGGDSWGSFGDNEEEFQMLAKKK
jgi:hypothetical protein